MLGKTWAFVCKHKALILAFAFYLLIAFARFPHILSNIASTIPGANGDAYQNLWGMWWVVYALFHLHTGIYYTKLLFWPVGSNLIYETMSPLGSIITAPLQAISLPFAYNALFFIGFPLSALGMFVLSDYIIANKNAAFVAGLIYAFSTIHIIQAYSRIDWMVIGWVPLSLYFLLRILKEERNYYNVIGFSLSFVFGIFIGDIEQGFMAFALYLFVVIFYLAYGKTRKMILTKKVLSQLLFAVILVFVLGSVEFIPILRIFLAKGGAGPTNSNLISVVNQINNIPFNIANSLDILSFFMPNFYNGLVPNKIFQDYYWKVFSVASVEKTGYLTYAAIVLAIIGIFKNRRSSIFWIGLALIFGLLSLGPYLTIAGTVSHLPLPYLVYHSIPLINIVREPDRFIDIFLIPFAILASYGYVAVEKSVIKLKYGNQLNRKYILVFIVTIIFLVETSGVPITNSSAIVPFTTTPQIPPFYYIVRNLTGNFSVMQLPAIPSSEGLEDLYPGEADYYSTASLKPLVGGYITRTNYSEYIYLYNLPLADQAKNLGDFGVPIYVSPINENYTNQTLLALYNFRTAFIAVNLQAYNSTALDYLYAYLVNTFGAPVYQSNTTIAFETNKAVQKALFRSFVAYPVLQDWNYTPLQYQGLSLSTWSPTGDGLVAIYAPYPNGLAYSTIPNEVYTVNATMKFTAFSTGNQYEHLEIGEQTGDESPVALTTVNVTPYLKRYTIKLNDLVSGPSGNYALFVGDSQQGSENQIRIYNITISRN